MNPTPRSPSVGTRQQAYLRALRTIPNLRIRYGHFLAGREAWPEVFPENPDDPGVPNPANRITTVWVTEEKGSDVNLATQLILDAAEGDFDVAWVFTNDSDLAWPIQEARKRYRQQERGQEAEGWLEGRGQEEAVARLGRLPARRATRCGAYV